MIFNKSDIFKIIMLVTAIVALISFSVITSFNDTEYVVTDKERIVSSKTSKYLVFTENEQGETIVFENTDNVLRGKWDSSNIQGKLKIGNTYKVTVVGYRIPFLSEYQNILEIEGVENA